MWQQMVDYFQGNMGVFILSVGQHLGISLMALALAALVGIPAAILCVRHKGLQKYIVSIFQVLRIIPSLAILLLLIPILGTGTLPALVALTLLGIPPILMNTVAALDGVPAFMLETAEGCGMTDRQVWRMVRFPLAMPMIFTGIRTAVVEILASATLAAKIGAGGLGEIIFTGIGLYRIDLLLIGGITVALLSLLAGSAVDLISRLVLRYKYVH